MRMMMIPGLITEITNPKLLGPHQYLGNKQEGNGIIYTHRGGFIDMGHLRDQADWTAYLFELIKSNKSNGIFLQKLGHEGGAKTLSIEVPEVLTEEDMIRLAGKIAYDLSVWHEIATWFGASYIPLLPERFSSFSIEDAYSNLLGSHIGMQALRSALPFEEAMTQLIQLSLIELEAVQSNEETYQAMEEVHNLWWTRDKKLPSRKVLLHRELGVYPSVKPLLVPNWNAKNMDLAPLAVPQLSSLGKELDAYYILELKLNFKFPVKKLFPDREGRRITQEDFGHMIEYINRELL
jgi:hypothetical protein